MDRHGILVAVTPSGWPSAMEALSDTLPLTPAHTVEQVVQLLLVKSFCLIIGTLQFDESRLFELFPLAKRTGTPILAAKLQFSVLSEEYIARTCKSAMLMGNDACFDVQAMERKVGRQGAFEAFREVVLKTAKKECA